MTGIASREVTPAPAVAPTAPTDVQEAALDREARQLAMKFRTAKLDEQPALRRQLEQLTERHFEQRQQRRQREIDDLGQRLDKLRVTHHRRQENKATVIQQRIQDLLDPNADLRWDEPRTNEVSNPNASSRVGTAHPPEGVANAIEDKSGTVGTAHPTAASPVEPTFDGTPYSQWLKMLETERKPEKLASAMEACSRLVVKGDEQRIVRSIIAGGQMFEASEAANDRNTVFSAGHAGLRRLLNEVSAERSEIVAEELLACVSDPRFGESSEFVGEFFTSLAYSRPMATASLKSRTPAMIAALVRQDAASKDFNPKLAGTATAIWFVAKQPINDFEGLKPLVLKGYENAVEENKIMSLRPDLQSVDAPWWALHFYADQVPEIVTILGRHFDKHPDAIVEVLRAIGPAAEPTVPKLIERLVAIWKSHEEMDRATAAGRGSPDRDFAWQNRMGFVFDALQKIGPQAKSAVPILKEFLSICPADQDGDNVRQHRHWMKSAINDALRAIGDTADNTGTETPPVLSDFSHLTTIWKLTSSQPGRAIQGIRMSVGRVVEFSGPRGPQDEIIRLVGCGTNPRSYVIDESTTPKQITLLDKDRKDYQQFGIYELKGDRLKIEFAKPGLPRPKEFSADRDKLTEGHVLLEFERDRGGETP